MTGSISDIKIGGEINMEKIFKVVTYSRKNDDGWNDIYKAPSFDALTAALEDQGMIMMGLKFKEENGWMVSDKDTLEVRIKELVPEEFDKDREVYIIS